MTTLRIFGPKLGEQDTFIDATVERIDLDETVHLAATATDDDRTWDLPLSTVNSFRNNDTAARLSDISHPDHDIWGRLSGLNSDVYTKPFTDADVDLDTKLKDIFTTVMAIMTDDSP